MPRVPVDAVLEAVPPHGPRAGLLVVGSAGSGKTALLDGCAQAYRSAGESVVSITGRRSDAGDLAAVSAAVGRQVHAVEDGRRALLEVLDLDAGGVVVVDDGHLLDRATRTVLAGLVERPPASGVRMIVARRPGAPADEAGATLDAALLRIQAPIELPYRLPDDAPQRVAAEWPLLSPVARDAALLIAVGAAPGGITSTMIDQAVGELRAAGLVDDEGVVPQTVGDAAVAHADPALLADLEHRHPVAAGRARLARGEAAEALRCADAAVERGDGGGSRLAACIHAAGGRWASATAELDGATAGPDRAAARLARAVTGRPRRGSGFPAALEDGEGRGAEARCLALMASALERGTLPPLREACGLATDAPGVLLPDRPQAVLALMAAEACEFGAIPDGVGDDALDDEASDPRVRTALAWATMVAGDFHRTTRALREPSSTDSRREALVAAAVRVGLLVRVGDVDRLPTAWGAALEATREVSVDLLMVPMIGELRVAGHRLGRARDLRSLTAEVETLLDALGTPDPWTSGWAWRNLRAAVAGGDVAATEAAFEALRGLGGGLAPEFVAAARAWLLATKGTPDPDASLAGADALDGLGLRWEATRLLGATAVRQADGDAARRLLQRAREWREALPPIEMGSTDRPKGPLTEREWEVAERVLAGLTHKEAGAQLYMSPKTVEHHVARIRKKLGVSTRAQMMATLRELLDG